MTGIEITTDSLRTLTTTGKLLHPNSYDKVIVSYSGGKDSLALVLAMLDLGVDKSRIELWHQHVDGKPGERGLFDWPSTHGYVKATGEALGVAVRFQWKDGGIEDEMLRENANTKGVYYEDADLNIVYLPPSSRGKKSTRKMFPQVSADLSVRWCSAYVKIDVAARAINNDPRFKNAKILYLTGERRQESSARSKYAEVEPHRCNGKRRRADQWRAIIDWTEDQVWGVIEQHHVYPHPAYYLGYGRLSCQHCIFADNNQLATNRQIDGRRFYKQADYEEQFGKTIHRSLTVIERANKGTPFKAANDPELVALGMSDDYPLDRFYVPVDEQWPQPAGAYTRCAGPT